MSLFIGLVVVLVGVCLLKLKKKPMAEKVVEPVQVVEKVKKPRKKRSTKKI